MASKLFSSFFYFFYILILLPFYFNSTTLAILSNESDRLALLEFKARITSDPFGALSSWNDSIHFCQWYGVTCGRQNQRVTVLDIQSQKLVGSISPHIGNLSFLRNLFLVDNTFKQEIPLEISQLRRLRNLDLGNNTLFGEIPANLSSCLDLRTISLDANSLSGRLPMELGSLSKLWALATQFNDHIGEIPSSFGNLSSLIYLDLTRNDFSGSIPHTLGQLKSFKSLGIGDNKFTGTIPPSIFNLSMEGFDLGSNQIEGTLPSYLGIVWPNISFFSVADNHFVGSIPPSISNASNLEIFYLSSNNFTGKVPNLGRLHKLQNFGIGNNSLGFGEADDLSFISSLVNATILEDLQLTLNNFGGELPPSIGNLSKSTVQSLTIGANQIRGTIPPSIGNLLNLEELALRSNNLSGTIPEQIGNLRNLKRLNINQNQLTGNIPSSFGNLELLLELQLATNKLQGNIPPSLGNCTSLMSFGLAENLFNGSIPAQLFTISSLVIGLDLRDNDFTGSLPVEIENLVNLYALDVSGNRLSGEIPTGIGKCVSMEILYMSGNAFNGIIPPSLSSLKGLQYLDLSRNNLSGEIPEFLQKFVFLENLNLSFNSFVGTVPVEGVFLNASATSIEGNEGLCGGIPEFHLPVCKFDESQKKTKSPKLKIILSGVVAFLGAVMAIGTLLFFWLRKKKVSVSTSLKNSMLQVSYRTLFKSTGGFSSSNLIGMGSFGSVYKGIFDDERVFAIKVFNLQRRGALKSFLVECEAMKNIRHRNVVKVITACSGFDIRGDDFKALIYEFMVNGSLEEWLHPIHDVTRKLTFVQRLNIAIDVASGLDYLHHQYFQTPIVHCDLKPSNVLLDNEMTAQVSDFGLVKFLVEGIDNASTDQVSSIGVRGTVGYAAPEYGMGSEVSTHGDMYSYGILILEMLSGKKPTDDMFSDNLNLRNYVKMALPQQVEEIVDPILLVEEIEDERKQKVIDSLVLIFEIGLACSEEVPRERMDINVALTKLFAIQNNLRRAIHEIESASDHHRVAITTHADSNA